MTIQDVRNNLLNGLEEEYTKDDVRFIDIRLDEIADIERMSLDELNDYCWANANEMFACIFDYKVFNKDNFK